MTRLDALYLEHGQSAWVDNIRRDWLNDGTLQGLVDRGVRGVTSNPAIFAKALSTTPDYQPLIAQLDTRDPEEAFESLAIEDVRDACVILRPVYDASLREFSAGARRATDGYVSLEVSPRLAHDTQGTIDAAVRLAERLSDSPNLMIKIPATLAGLPAITEVIGRGISVNVTLIFSLARYAQVLDAYVAGLARARSQGLDLGSIASVASFFISRVDTAVDPLLSEGSPLRGRTAVAQAAAAYDLFLHRMSQSDVAELLAAGAQIQRPLWASTSTKNPTYDELLYVDTLVASETVNTLPDPTLEAYATKGNPLNSELEDAERRHTLAGVLADVEHSGVDLSAVTDQLENEGVSAFIKAYDELLHTVSAALTA